MNGWFVNWPQFMQLWKKVLVILTNIVICERGFSKQNAVKKSLVSFLEIGYFGCFDENFIMQH